MADRSPADCFVEVNALRLHYLDWGGPKHPPLVLLHGITGNAHNWDNFARQWQDRFHVLALDQRGHGDSDHARDGYPVTAFASDLYEFARALKLGQFNLAGISLGARNAIAFAGTHSDLLRHMVLVDCGPEIAVSGARNTQSRVGQRPFSFRSQEEAMAYFRQTRPGSSEHDLQQTVHYGLRQNWANKLVWKHDPDLFWITGSAGLKEVPYLWDQWAKVTCLALVLRGAKSEILSAEIMARMQAKVPRASYVAIPGAGHSIHLDQPEVFERIVRRFLLK